MDYKQALEYINGSSWRKSRLGLERVTELLSRMGNPQAELKFVHVAGTNGKGSICAMLASVLKRAGLKTGLFTSPYLRRFNERMQINGEQISDAELAEIVTELRRHADAMDEHPTEFEMMTAAALRWFADSGCDIVVLEVGLGGRCDATNAIPCPECCVIANIGLDHTAILGDTLESIAYEKAGIIKYGAAVVLYQQYGETMETVREVCREKSAELIVPDFDDISIEFDSIDGQVFSYGGESYAIPLLGAHQLRNAATVLETIEVLRRQGWEIDHDAVESGLYSVAWPARFEVLHADEPWFVLDGGHNLQCAAALRECTEHYFPDCERVALAGVLKDKDYRSIVKTLAPLFSSVVCVTPDSERALPAEELAGLFAAAGCETETAGSIEDGVELAQDKAREKGAMVCAFGSLYICGDVRACFGLR